MRRNRQFFALRLKMAGGRKATKQFQEFTGRQTIKTRSPENHPLAKRALTADE